MMTTSRIRKDAVDNASEARPRAARPTIRSVAAAVGVSPSLVSLAINGKAGVSEERRAEILHTARELGYSTNPVARALRTGDTMVYGLIARNFDNPLFSGVLVGMQDAAAETGHIVISLDSGYSRSRELLYMRNLAARRIEGLAIAPIGDAATVTEWQRLMPQANTVLINADGMPYPGVMHVSPDSERAVRLAFDHLYSLGHREIAFLCAPEGLMADSARLDAYLAQCADRGLTPRLFRSELDFESIVRSTRQLLDTGDTPSAVIANSDHAAHAIYAACHSLGVEVGTGLSVVGHDDLPTSALLDPPLTTLRLNRRSLGREAFARLLGTAAGDYREPIALIARSSTVGV